MARLRAVVVGLDGADHELVHEMMVGGELPYLRKLAESGFMQPMISTTPPITPVAWNSIYTGVNPGMHGVFDFSGRPRSDSTHLNTSLDRDATPFWAYLNEAGLRTVLVNMPMCYPPDPVDGVMVSGFGGPERPGVSPPAMAEEFDRRFPDYGTFCHPMKNRYWQDFDGYVEKLKLIATRQVEATTELVQMLDPDIAMLVLPSTDTVCHLAFHLHDPTHPAHVAGRTSPIVDVYRHIDAEVGQLVEDLTPNDQSLNVFILSDHGSKPIHRMFNVNLWLERAGYLFFAERQLRDLRGQGRLPPTLKSHFRGVAMRIDNWATSGWRRRALDLLPSFLFPARSRTFRSIDWRRTVAYGRGTYGQLWLNESLTPASREDVLSRLESDICALRIDAKPAFELLRGDSLYSGPHASAGPDAYLAPCIPTTVPNNRLDYLESDPVISLLTKLDPKHDYGFSGWHGQQGILIASGADVRQNPPRIADDVTVLDLAPTLLHLFDVPVPAEMEGRVLADLLVPSSAPPDRRDPLPTGEISRAQSAAHGSERLTPEEEGEIVEHLRGLGYL